MGAASYGFFCAWIDTDGGEVRTRQADPEDCDWETERVEREMRAFYATLAGARARRLVKYSSERGFETLLRDGEGWQELPGEFSPGGYY